MLIGVPAYVAQIIPPIAAHRERLARFLASQRHIAVIAYAEATMVPIGVLLLSVLGLA